MVQSRQNLPLPQEMIAEQLEVEGKTDYFDGNGLFELFVGAMGKVHRSHAAAAEEAFDPVGAQAASGRRTGFGIRGRRRAGRRFPGGQELADFPRQLRVAAAAFGDHSLPVAGGCLEDGVKDRLRPAELFDSVQSVVKWQHAILLHLASILQTEDRGKVLGVPLEGGKVPNRCIGEASLVHLPLTFVTEQHRIGER